ncbi:MAG: LysR family transcriptional regulator [Rhodobacteraceae bacterium]|nr:MAG: LysR family transcriptional regulator [Paracoccaceae bacterium]
MNWSTLRFDWNQARAFLVTAEEGSLSAAARALGMTQPTLGRQVAALEEGLGVTLFARTGRAMTLTEAGRDLLAHVRRMGEAAQGFSLAATGQAQAVEGHVTISASDVMAVHVLPRILTPLRQIAPGISVEIVASNDLADLRRREADIALRHVRPTQPDLIARRLREDHARLYATPVYIDRFGLPEGLHDLGRILFAAFEPMERFFHEMSARGLVLTRRNVQVSSDNAMVLMEAVRSGDAIGILTADMAALIPEARIVLPEFPPFVAETWLVSHAELQTNRRIRLVYDVIAQVLSR